MRDNLLSEEAEDVFEEGEETENGPIVSPETEGLLTGVVLEGNVSLTEGDQNYDSVVNETSEVFLHLFLDFRVSFGFNLYKSFLTIWIYLYKNKALNYQ